MRAYVVVNMNEEKKQKTKRIITSYQSSRPYLFLVSLSPREALRPRQHVATPDERLLTRESIYFVFVFSLF